MLLVRQLRLALGSGQQAAFAAAQKRLGVSPGQVAFAGVARLSVDARRTPPVLVYSVALALTDPAAEPALAGRPGVALLQRPAAQLLPQIAPARRLMHRPVVCGLGPAGLFCALALARQGYRPLVLERGPALDGPGGRVQAVEAFLAGGPLSPNANIQFGEGGAGTFSDGKLTTRIGDALCGLVTDTLLAHGAPPEIAWQQRPHIGTDLLRGVILSMRRELEALGGQVLFGTALTGLVQQNGRLAGVQTTAGQMPCEALVLAVGHSARDTFAMLAQSGLPLCCKPFSVGVRAEHLQTQINKGLYHGAAGHPGLPPGEYQLSRRLPSFGGRCVYTFCMCPGGQVVPAASEVGGVVTNGMSLHARNGPNANAAVVVSVDGADFGGDPLKAVAFQRGLEQAAFAAGGGGYAAPAETLGSFLAGRGRLELGRVAPSYARGVRPADLGGLLGDELSGALRAGLRAFGRMLPGYDAPDTVLTGPETRTSSPVRIPRGDTLEAEALTGLYPCGEGAGYAGGIVSAAVDGLRAARAILAGWQPPAGGG